MGPFGIDYILNLLPHRYPFLLVDRIEELVDGPEKGRVWAIVFVR